jgi:uncharacterized protein (UPF0276 family)
MRAIPRHGIGLSVDVYQPDLVGLLVFLRERQVRADYLEVFRAGPRALAAIRNHTDMPLAYHGEGVWLTQPEAYEDPLFRSEVDELARHVEILGSAWLNHECATKHLAGYSFGTYLPPLYTAESAAVVAENTAYVQQAVDDRARASARTPALVLLEMPPLTYFVAGSVSIPTFFRLVTEAVPCGLVLDIGHLWTVYRYSGAWRGASLRQFVGNFLDEFPLERVVQIHVAGLAVHPAHPQANGRGPHSSPAWLDAHAAPIPPVLFEMLDQVLDHPSLKHLTGLALEVDTKPPALIADELERVAERYAGVWNKGGGAAGSQVLAAAQEEAPVKVSSEIRQSVRRAYSRYARIAAGQCQPEGPEWTGGMACTDELASYHQRYLPHEILHWGGDVMDMFPHTVEYLGRHAVDPSAFVAYWFQRPRPLVEPYDFFVLKLDRFVDFIRETAPGALGIVSAEAEDLRRAYAYANEPAPVE